MRAIDRQGRKQTKQGDAMGPEAREFDVPLLCA